MPGTELEPAMGLAGTGEALPVGAQSTRQKSSQLRRKEEAAEVSLAAERSDGPKSGSNWEAGDVDGT